MVFIKVKSEVKDEIPSESFAFQAVTGAGPDPSIIKSSAETDIYKFDVPLVMATLGRRCTKTEVK